MLDIVNWKGNALSTKKKIVIGLLLLVIVITCCFRLTPNGRVKAIARAYNRWSDPGLVRRHGIKNLISFFFLNLIASNRLESLLADDCSTTYVRPDGSTSSGRGRDMVSSLTGILFTSNVEQIAMGDPVITKNEDEYWVRMKKAFCEGNSIMIAETKLIIRSYDGKFLISEIKQRGRQPSDEEISTVKSILHSGSYDYDKGFRVCGEGLDYSPDGTMIVFSALDKKKRLGDICLMAADGSGLMKLTDSKYREVCPIFTPDGQSVLFYCDKDNYAGEPYLIDIDGTNFRRLLPEIDGVSGVVYSPDGRYIAFTVQQGLPKEVYVMETGSSELVQITESGKENYALIFSPNSKGLYYKQKWYEYDKYPALHEQLFAVSVEGGKPRQLTNNRDPKTPVAVLGNTVFYSLTLEKEGKYKNILRRIKSDGSENKVVMGIMANGRYLDTQVLPGSNAILFKSDIHKSFSYQVYLKQLSSNGKLVQLTHHGQCVLRFTISPSGDEIAYTARPRNLSWSGWEREIYKMSINNGQPVFIGKNR